MTKINDNLLTHIGNMLNNKSNKFNFVPNTIKIQVYYNDVVKHYKSLQ